MMTFETLMGIGRYTIDIAMVSCLVPLVSWGCNHSMTNRLDFDATEWIQPCRISYVKQYFGNTGHAEAGTVP
jgi:hypothetical protein